MVTFKTWSQIGLWKLIGLRGDFCKGVWSWRKASHRAIHLLPALVGSRRKSVLWWRTKVATLLSLMRMSGAKQEMKLLLNRLYEHSIPTEELERIVAQVESSAKNRDHWDILPILRRACCRRKYQNWCQYPGDPSSPSKDSMYLYARLNLQWCMDSWTRLPSHDNKWLKGQARVTISPVIRELQLH